MQPFRDRSKLTHKRFVQSKLSKEEIAALFAKYSPNEPTMSVDGFTSFLLSQDNAVFLDQHSQVHHDMTRPLPEYYISSSHNTYLVGHQLVGDSTIEGYIRALLHSCRSVEGSCLIISARTSAHDNHAVDIYDGDTEPMIFHGKTFTSKVSLRQVCEAIKKYGFVASPYPIIISAEVHCGLHQQDMIAEIMLEVFGDSLVREPLPPVVLPQLESDASRASTSLPKIEVLPSPEDLKGKIMLKVRCIWFSSAKTSS